MVLFFFEKANGVGLVESTSKDEAVLGIRSDDATKVTDVYHAHPEMHEELKSFSKDPGKAVLRCRELRWNVIIVDYVNNENYSAEYQEGEMCGFTLA